MVKTLTLVCEGRCNPAIDRVDDAVARFQHLVYLHDIVDARAMAGEAVASAYTRVQHTEHVVTTRPNFARCVHCGTERRHANGPGFDGE